MTALAFSMGCSAVKSAIFNYADLAEPTATASVSVPFGLLAIPDENKITLYWVGNPEVEVVAYTVYRSHVSGSRYLLMARVSADVTYVDKEVESGSTYFYRVRAVTKVGTLSNPSSEVRVEAGVIPASPQVDTGPDLTGVLPPALFITHAQAGNALSWSVLTGPTISRFAIYRGVSLESMRIIGSVAPTSSIYVDKSPPTGTVFYAVRAIYGGVKAGPLSSIVAVTPGLKMEGIPELSAPDSVMVVAQPDAVSLQWGAVIGANTYRVYRRFDGNGGFGFVGEAHGTSFLDRSLDSNGTYFYLIRAVDSNGVQGLLSSVVSIHVLTSATGGVVLNRPMGLEATANDDSVTLSWILGTDATLGGYQIYRKEVTDPAYAFIATLKRVTTFRDPFVEVGKTYLYRIRGVDTVGNLSDPSDPAQVLVETEAIIQGRQFGPPTNVQLTSLEQKVQLKWDVNLSPDTQGLSIYRSTVSGTGYQKVADVPAGTLGYVDSNLINGIRYFYVLKSADSVGTLSAASREVSGIPEQSDVTIGSPTLIQGRWDGTAIQLSWDSVTESDLMGYRVERSVVAGSGYEIVATLGSAVTLFRDTDVAMNVRYYYVIRALGRSGVVSVRSPESTILAGS